MKIDEFAEEEEEKEIPQPIREIQTIINESRSKI